MPEEEELQDEPEEEEEEDDGPERPDRFIGDVAEAQAWAQAMSGGQQDKDEPTPEQMAAFYADHPECVGKFVDTDASAFEFGSKPEPKDKLPGLLKQLKKRLSGG